MPNLTEAQKRALAWLPGDGSFRNAVRAHSTSLMWIAYYRHDLVDKERGKFGGNGNLRSRYRLTPAGIDLKAEMETGNANS